MLPNGPCDVRFARLKCDQASQSLMCLHVHRMRCSNTVNNARLAQFQEERGPALPPIDLSRTSPFTAHVASSSISDAIMNDFLENLTSTRDSNSAL